MVHDSRKNPTNEFKQSTLALNNRYVLGQIKASDVQSILAAADILLVCYQESAFDDQANPHKLMEYLGSGKVVVATNTLEFLGLRDMIAMAERNSEMPHLFRQVAENIENYNSDLMSIKRKDFAFANSYDNQIKRIESYLSKL